MSVGLLSAAGRGLAFMRAPGVAASGALAGATGVFLGQTVNDEANAPGEGEAAALEIRQMEREMLRRAAMRARVRRLQRGQAINAARLAALDPHLYNEIVAQRRLPRGSTIIGQPPSGDALSEITMMMAEGDFANTELA